jgi:hypothetical protein
MPDFHQWMTQLDRLLMLTLGMTHHDLPDQLYADWHASGMTPRDAIKEILASEGIQDTEED